MSYISIPRFASRAGTAGHASLGDDQLRRLAPSAFATGKHESRSERYTYIPTSAVVDGLRANGFTPTFAKQGNSRVPGKAEFTKHLIRFRYEGETGRARRVGQVYPEVVLVNSHDGTSAYHLMAGLFRLVCLNGLVAADRELEALKVPHKGDVVGQVIEGSYTVLSESIRALDRAEEWAGVRLDRAEQAAFAETAHELRFERDEQGRSTTPILPEQLLAARRRDDAADDLFTVTNRIQENVIRGGLTAIGRDANNRPRRVTTREVRGIDQDVRLNRALWLLGERMAQIKGA